VTVAVKKVGVRVKLTWQSFCRDSALEVCETSVAASEQRLGSSFRRNLRASSQGILIPILPLSQELKSCTDTRGSILVLRKYIPISEFCETHTRMRSFKKNSKNKASGTADRNGAGESDDGKDSNSDQSNNAQSETKGAKPDQTTTRSTARKAVVPSGCAAASDDYSNPFDAADNDGNPMRKGDDDGNLFDASDNEGNAIQDDDGGNALQADNDNNAMLDDDDGNAMLDDDGGDDDDAVEILSDDESHQFGVLEDLTTFWEE
jgi:hypothetical protein